MWTSCDCWFMIWEKLQHVLKSLRLISVLDPGWDLLICKMPGATEDYRNVTTAHRNYRSALKNVEKKYMISLFSNPENITFYCKNNQNLLLVYEIVSNVGATSRLYVQKVRKQNVWLCVRHCSIDVNKTIFGGRIQDYVFKTAPTINERYVKLFLSCCTLCGRNRFNWTLGTIPLCLSYTFLQTTPKYSQIAQPRKILKLYSKI